MAAVRAVSLYSILALTLVIAVRPTPLAGQPAALPGPSGRATFALIGSMKLDDYALTTVGLELLNIERGGPGSRIAITTAPRVLREGIFWAAGPPVTTHRISPDGRAALVPGRAEMGAGDDLVGRRRRAAAIATPSGAGYIGAR